MKEHRELQTLIDELERHITYQGKEVDRLHEQNQELLEALKELLRVESTHDDGEIILEVARHNAKKVIAKATGEQA